MPKRILIADDHLSVLKATRAVVEHHSDWEVCGEATDGQDAVEKAIELRPDVIILDLSMPRRHGLSAAQEICALMPAVPILLHTLYGSPQLALEAKSHGIRATVEKRQSGALVSAIERVLATDLSSHTHNDATRPEVVQARQSAGGLDVGRAAASSPQPAAVQIEPANIEHSKTL